MAFFSSNRLWLGLAAFGLAVFIRLVIGEPRFIPTGSMLPTLRVDDRLMVEKVSYDLHGPQRGDIVVFRAPTDPSQDYIKRVVGLPGDQLQVQGGRLLVQGVPMVRDQLLNYFFVAYPGLEQLLTSHPNLSENYQPTFLLRLLPNGVDLHLDFPSQGFTPYFLGRSQLAHLIGIPSAQLTLEPGQVYINGVALSEPYTAEDPDYDCPGECLFKVPVVVPQGEYFVMGDNRNNSRDSHEWGFLPRQNIIGKAWVRFWPLNRLGFIE